MRESGPWTYAVVNLCHIIGVATLFGSVLLLDLRLLGVWRRVPLAPMTDAASTLAQYGFAIAATAGIGLLATKTTEYVGNPFVYIKFPAIAVALVNALAVRLSPAWRARRIRELTPAEHRQLALMGATSLVCWTIVISAGRLIAYW